MAIWIQGQFGNIWKSASQVNHCDTETILKNCCYPSTMKNKDRAPASRCLLNISHTNTWTVGKQPWCTMMQTVSLGAFLRLLHQRNSRETQSMGYRQHLQRQCSNLLSQHRNQVLWERGWSAWRDNFQEVQETRPKCRLMPMPSCGKRTRQKTTDGLAETLLSKHHVSFCAGTRDLWWREEWDWH